MLEIATIILAAGKGERMHSDLPKVLHPLCGKPMIDYTLGVAKSIRGKSILVVTPKQGDNRVDQYLKNGSNIRVIHQTERQGTGGAVMACKSYLENFSGSVLILYGDCPLLQGSTLQKFLQHFSETDATLGFISAKLEDPTGYGRVVRDAQGEVLRVVEEKEATPSEKSLRESNMGVYAVQSEWLLHTLKKLKPHPIKNEYYLTDIIELAVSEKQKLVGFLGEEPQEFLGINSRKQLAVAEEILRQRFAQHWLERGVSFVDPKQIYIEADVHIGVDTVIAPQVYLQGKTKIGKNCRIDCGVVLKDMTIEDGVHIKPYSVLEESHVAKEAQVGPFAHVRPASHIGPRARVGNFVELKKTTLEAGVKANHLSYLGDAYIGSETNIGCGTITCNYDGVKKHPTKIGKKVFVGSDVSLVAPVKIGDGAYIGAGSTVTEDVPKDSLAIARARQVNKIGWAKKKK